MHKHFYFYFYFFEYSCYFQYQKFCISEIYIVFNCLYMIYVFQVLYFLFFELVYWYFRIYFASFISNPVSSRDWCKFAYLFYALMFILLYFNFSEFLINSRIHKFSSKIVSRYAVFNWLVYKNVSKRDKITKIVIFLI